MNHMPANNPARAKRRRRDPIQHWLLSIVHACGGHLHGYLASADRSDTLGLAEMMLDEAEKAECLHRFSSTVLLTELSTNIERVRAIVAARSAEAERMLREETDVQWMIWSTPIGDPDDVALMALH